MTILNNEKNIGYSPENNLSSLMDRNVESSNIETLVDDNVDRIKKVQV